MFKKEPKHFTLKLSSYLLNTCAAPIANVFFIQMKTIP